MDLACSLVSQMENLNAKQEVKIIYKNIWMSRDVIGMIEKEIQ